MSSKLRIVCQEDCGNAPRKEILRDFIIAFITKDLVHVQEWLSENIVWNIIGDRQLTGKEQVLEYIFSLLTGNPIELQIDHIITHGKTASLNGNIKFEEGIVLEFCDIYEFINAGKKSKIKEITSYRL